MVWKNMVMKNKWGLRFLKRKKISRWKTGFKPIYCDRLVESLMIDFVPTFSIVENWRFLTEMEQGISYQYRNHSQQQLIYRYHKHKTPPFCEKRGLGSQFIATSVKGYFLVSFSYLSRSAFSISRLMGIPVFTDISLTFSINFLSIVVLIVSRLILLFGRAIFYPFHIVLCWWNYK